MADVLSIVFWNPNDIKAATSIFEGDRISMAGGMSISEFFRKRGITVQKFLETFPECMDLNKRQVVENMPVEMWDWDIPKARLVLPGGQDGLQKLANWLDVKVKAYEFIQGKTPQPKLYCQVIPVR